MYTRIIKSTQTEVKDLPQYLLFKGEFPVLSELLDWGMSFREWLGVRAGRRDLTILARQYIGHENEECTIAHHDRRCMCVGQGQCHT